mmetsp:Transcript_55998/g.162261  ORF Transcript_55998/g.162261 Transcript_55998/m.162261 type:complete len:301 (-) Transcript_55998:602-1504(-)
MRRAGQCPVQCVARLLRKDLPRRPGVPGPKAQAEASHAGREGAVQRPAPLPLPPSLVGLVLRHVPPLVLEVVGLTFVVPPELNAVVEVVLVLLGVPMTSVGVREVQIPLDGVELRVRIRRVPAGSTLWQQVAIRPGEGQVLRVAQPRLSDASHAEMQLLTVLRKLPRRVWEGLVRVAEVHTGVLSLGAVAVVRLACVPFEIDDESVRWEAARPESREGVLDVLAVRPTPAGGDEAEGPQRRHSRPPDEAVIGHRTELKRGARQKVELEGAGPRVPPEDTPPRGVKRRRQGWAVAGTLDDA